MGKRDDLIEKYAEDLRTKCDETPDMELLKKVTMGLGSAIYNRESGTVSGSDSNELETVRKNFLMGKLGLAEGPELMGGIQKALTTYGRGERRKHRAVVYYLLVKHFGKEGVYA